MLQLVEYPYLSLSYKCLPLKKVDAQIKTWASEMLELMRSAKGVGLAANQVGLPYRLFVADFTGYGETVVINPVITKRTGERLVENEGCLSLNGIELPVIRPSKITLTGWYLDGSELNVELSDLNSRIAQHECDHLDGVMFFERAASVPKDVVRFIKHKVAKYDFDNVAVKRHLDSLASEMT